MNKVAEYNTKIGNFVIIDMQYISFNEYRVLMQNDNEAPYSADYGNPNIWCVIGRSHTLAGAKGMLHMHLVECHQKLWEEIGNFK